MQANTNSPESRFGEFYGVRQLKGAEVNAIDLRAGAAMVIAALAADGVSNVSNIHLIERGYDDIVGKLTAVGAEIEKLELPEGEEFPSQQE